MLKSLLNLYCKLRLDIALMNKNSVSLFIKILDMTIWNLYFTNSVVEIVIA